MAQFGVRRNKAPRKDTIPFVVVLQSALFNGYRSRVVVPLVRLSPLSPEMAGSHLNPRFTVDGGLVVLHPLEIVSVALDQLGEHAGSLAEHGQAITDAPDEVFTRAGDHAIAN